MESASPFKKSDIISMVPVYKVGVVNVSCHQLNDLNIFFWFDNVRSFTTARCVFVSRWAYTVGIFQNFPG